MIKCPLRAHIFILHKYKKCNLDDLRFFWDVTCGWLSMYCKWHCTIVSLGAAEEPNNMRSQASQSAYKWLWPARQPRPLTLGFLPSATEITATGTISFTVHLCHTLEENVLYETSTLHLQSKILQIFQGKQNDVYNSLLKQLKYKPKPGVKIISCLLWGKFVTHIYKISSTCW